MSEKLLPLSFDKRHKSTADRLYEPSKEELIETQYDDGELFLSTGTQTPSKNSLFLGSCVLVNKEINHRVLINKNSIGSFNLFSCYLKDQTFCPYEVNK